MIECSRLRLGSYSMKKKIINFYRKIVISTLWPVAFLLSGCTSEKTKHVQRPVPLNPSSAETQTLDLIAYYRQEKYPMVIKSAQILLEKDPKNWEAELFRGLAYFNYGDKEAANISFGNIPENIRKNMVDSCLELQAIKSRSNRKDLQQVANKFFPDCLSDLLKDSAPFEKQAMNKSDILNLGRLYDLSMSGEDDPEIRKFKEQKFLKTHDLSEEQLSEITARYLELLAEE